MAAPLCIYTYTSIVIMYISIYRYIYTYIYIYTDIHAHTNILIYICDIDVHSRQGYGIEDPDGRACVGLVTRGLWGGYQ